MAESRERGARPVQAKLFDAAPSFDVAQQNEDYIGRSHGHPFFVRSTRWLLPPPLSSSGACARGRVALDASKRFVRGLLAELASAIFLASVSERRVAPSITAVARVFLIHQQALIKSSQP